MPTARRKIAGDPLLPEGWLDLSAAPSLPEGWVELPASGPAVSSFDARISAVSADPLGRRFEGTGAGPEELNAAAMAKHDAAKKDADDHAAKVLRGAYDPTADFETGASGYLRFIDIARSDDLVNKQRKFRETFGESAELVQLSQPNGELRLYARRSPDDPFRAVPKSPAVAASILSEPAVLSTAGSFIPDKTTTGVVAGTMLGVGLQKVVEDVRGYPEKTWLDTANRATQEGYLAGLTDLAFRGASNMLFHRAFTTSAAAKAAAEEGFEPLAIGQVSDSLLIQTGYRQIARLGLAGTPKHIDKTRLSLLEAAQRQVAAGGDLTDVMIQDIVRVQRDELDRLLSPKQITRKETAQALQNSIATYEKASDAWVKELYDHAITLSKDVVFDATPAIAKANEIATGVQVLLKKAAEEGEEVVVGRASPALVGELNAVVKLLQGMEPVMQPVKTEAGEWTAFEGIKQLRTRLWAIKTDPEAGLMQKYAGELYETLTGVMASPISGNPQFVRAWKVASGAHYLREKNLEMAYVGRIVAGAHENPEALQAIAARYFSPGHATELATFKGLMEPRAWEKIQNGFQTDLMTTPSVEGARARLFEFKRQDPEGFKLLVSSTAERDIDHFLNIRKRVEDSPFGRSLERNLDPQERVRYLLTNGTQQDMADLVTISGGKDSDAVRALKAGTYSLILRDSSETLTSGVRVLNPRKLIAVAEDLRKGGKLDPLFTDADWKRLTNYQVYAATVADVADSGTSIQRAELAAGILAAPAKTLWGDAGKVVKHTVAPIVSMSFVGQLLATPAAYGPLVSGTGSWARRGADALAVIEAEYTSKTQESKGWRWAPGVRP